MMRFRFEPRWPADSTRFILPTIALRGWRDRRRAIVFVWWTWQVWVEFEEAEDADTSNTNMSSGE